METKIQHTTKEVYYYTSTNRPPDHYITKMNGIKWELVESGHTCHPLRTNLPTSEYMYGTVRTYKKIDQEILEKMEWKRVFIQGIEE